MAIQTRQRITGLLLALCLNAAFIAMFAWQARPRGDDVPDSSRMALVWAKQVIETVRPAPAAPAQPARQTETRRKPASAVPVAASEARPPAPPAELILESDSADPFEAADSATVKSFDKAVMGKAINVAMAERKAIEDTQKFVKSAPGLTRYQQFGADVEDATLPYCLGSDPMKLAPPEIKVGGVTIGLGSLLALPFLAKAAATGKCRIK